MIDEATLEMIAGDGGRGAVSFRREKFVPRGGPDGGTGGRGGHCIVVATSQLNTLRRYRHQHRFQAESGQPGGGSNKSGRDGADLILEVPVGTAVSRRNGEAEGPVLLADLTQDGEGVVVAQGGRGGLGNTAFKSSTNRAPRVAQVGQPGEHTPLHLELRLLADVGLVGLPNVGKSTLLGQVSAAQPRVAPYPFTPLEPHLGVVSIDWDEFVMADLPGLIEGAAEGAGLGHAFLRHASRTRLLVHLIDGSAPDPLADFDLINRELAAYDAALAAKPQIVVVNKTDLATVQDASEGFTAQFARRDIEVLFISAATGDGVRDLIARCYARLQDLRRDEAQRATTAPPRILQPRPDPRRYEVLLPEAGRFRVCGGQVEAFVQMMDVGDEEARAEIYRWMTRRGVTAALRRAGIQHGDRVSIGTSAWTWDA